MHMEHLVLPLLLLMVSVPAFPSFAGRIEDVKSIVSLSNKLAVDMHKKLSAEDKNVFFSPLSISTALAMLFYGTRGITAAEMKTVLGYEDEGLTDCEVHQAFKNLLERLGEESVNEYVLNIVNAVMTQKGFSIRSEYRNGLQDIYSATAQEVDFRNKPNQAIEVMNSWVQLKTKGQIKTVLNDVDPATVMILLNAVYFKGTWKTQFDPKVTFNGVFYNKGLESQKVTVPMMTLKEHLLYARLEGISALELPYKGEDISMVILLPDEEYGLDEVEKELRPTTWRDVLTEGELTKITVVLPKFQLEYEKTLNQVLRDLGLESIFESPDLSGISEAASLRVSEVVHKAKIEVNEEGSEASAVTGVIVSQRVMGLNKYFFVNRPFLFAIFHKASDMILFQGRVNKF